MDNFLALDKIGSGDQSLAQVLFKPTNPKVGYSLAREIGEQTLDAIDERMAQVADLKIGLDKIGESQPFKDFVEIITDPKLKASNAAYAEMKEKVIDEFMDSLSRGSGQFAEAVKQKMEPSLILDAAGNVLSKPKTKMEAFLEIMKDPNIKFNAGELQNLKRTTDNLINWESGADPVANQFRKEMAQVFRTSYQDLLKGSDVGNEILELEGILHHLIPVRHLLGKRAGEISADNKMWTRLIPSPMYSFERAIAQSAERLVSSGRGQEILDSVIAQASKQNAEMGGAFGLLKDLYSKIPPVKEIGQFGGQAGMGTGLAIDTMNRQSVPPPTPIPLSTQAIQSSPELISRLLKETDAITGGLLKQGLNDPSQLRDSLQEVKARYPNLFEPGYGIDGVLSQAEIPQYDLEVGQQFNRGELSSLQLLEERKAYNSGRPQPKLIQSMQQITPRQQLIQEFKQREFSAEDVFINIKKNPLPSQTITEASKSKRENY